MRAAHVPPFCFRPLSIEPLSMVCTDISSWLWSLRSLLIYRSYQNWRWRKWVGSVTSSRIALQDLLTGIYKKSEEWYVYVYERHSDLMVSALFSGSGGPVQARTQAWAIAFCSEALLSHSASLHAGLQTLGVTLQLTSILSRGNKNIPSRLTL